MLDPDKFISYTTISYYEGPEKSTDTNVLVVKKTDMYAIFMYDALKFCLANKVIYPVIIDVSDLIKGDLIFFMLY